MLESLDSLEQRSVVGDVGVVRVVFFQVVGVVRGVTLRLGRVVGVGRIVWVVTVWGVVRVVGVIVVFGAARVIGAT